MIISLGNEICNKVNTRLEEIQTREFAILSLRFLYKEKKKDFDFLNILEVDMRRQVPYPKGFMGSRRNTSSKWPIFLMD